MTATKQEIVAYDLGEEGETWMVEGTLDPDEAKAAVFALWAEQNVEAEYAEQINGAPMEFKPSDAWWWESVSPEYPDQEAWLRGIINGNPAPKGTPTFTGVLVTV